MTIYVMRALVKVRESLATHTQLARELAALKGRVDTLDATLANNSIRCTRPFLG
jgi:hypothetical protein